MVELQLLVESSSGCSKEFPMVGDVGDGFRMGSMATKLDDEV